MTHTTARPTASAENPRRRAARFLPAVAVALALAAALPAPPADAAQPQRQQETATRLASFDESRGGSPEGVTAGRDGRVYVALKPVQQLVRIDAHGRTTVVASLPGKATGLGGLVGLATAPDGGILGALANTDPRYNGLWYIRPDGAFHRLAALPTSAFPNDVTVTKDGRAALVTDSTGGRVFRVRLSDGRVTTWLRSDLLTISAGATLPIGANGITYRSPREVVVANTERSTLVSVPVRPDGSAGVPVVLARVPQPDGVRALGGDLYVAQPFQNLVVRISAAGTRTILADQLQDLDVPVGLLVRATRQTVSVLATDSSFTTAASRPGVTRILLRRGGRAS